MPTTLKANMIVPEVMADLVESKLGSRVTLLPIAVQDNTLQGQPGDTLKFPAFRYIGKAEVVAENTEVVPSLLSSFAVAATVKKYAKAVQLTDEARLSGYGDPVGEAASQLALSIDQAMDDALFAALDGLPVSRLVPITALSAASVAVALAAYGEDLDGPKLIIVDPLGFAALRKDANYIRASDLGQRAIFSGVVGEIWGCQIVVSNKVKLNAALGEFRYYIVKPGALRLVNKQGTLIEVEREAKFMRDNIFASKHAAAYLYDTSRVVAASVFSAVEVMDAAASGIKSVAAPGVDMTYNVIPEEQAAPAGLSWKYLNNNNTTTTVTFGTAVTGLTAWPGSSTAIDGSTFTYGHLYLVDSANKPYKVVNFPLVKGTA